jgi:hypothetical protein
MFAAQIVPTLHELVVGSGNIIERLDAGLNGMRRSQVPCFSLEKGYGLDCDGNACANIR